MYLAYSTMIALIFLVLAFALNEDEGNIYEVLDRSYSCPLDGNIQNRNARRIIGQRPEECFKSQKHGNDVSLSKRQKHTTVGIRWSSPTQLLIHRSQACVWQSGRDAQFS